MLVFLQLLFDVAQHGGVDGTVYVVPFQRGATV
jgi:hypothetical protein